MNINSTLTMSFNSEGCYFGICILRCFFCFFLNISVYLGDGVKPDYFYQTCEGDGWFFWCASRNLKTQPLCLMNILIARQQAVKSSRLRAMLHQATRLQGVHEPCAACEMKARACAFLCRAMTSRLFRLLVWHPCPANHSANWLFTLSCLIHFHLRPEGAATLNL